MPIWVPPTKKQQKRFKNYRNKTQGSMKCIQDLLAHKELYNECLKVVRQVIDKMSVKRNGVPLFTKMSNDKA